MRVFFCTNSNIGALTGDLHSKLLRNLCYRTVPFGEIGAQLQFSLKTAPPNSRLLQNQARLKPRHPLKVFNGNDKTERNSRT